MLNGKQQTLAEKQQPCFFLYVVFWLNIAHGISQPNVCLKSFCDSKAMVLAHDLVTSPMPGQRLELLGAFKAVFEAGDFLAAMVFNVGQNKILGVTCGSNRTHNF